jgi:hypothetical protein
MDLDWERNWEWNWALSGAARASSRLYLGLYQPEELRGLEAQAIADRGPLHVS